MALADELSSYATSLRYSDLSPHAIHTTKQRLVDSLGCGLGAFHAPPSRNGRAFAEAHPSTAATILGTRQTTTADIAAFVTGTMVRYFDFNDGYIGKEVGHPSDNIPVCLAVGESQKASGEDLILAIVLAYEMQCRFQDAANLHSGGWDHVNFVLVSSAVAAGRLMGLSQQQLTEAINIAVNSHIALRQVRSGNLSQWKGCSAPNAARNGIVAAELAKHDFTGPSPIFEGEMGFMNQITGIFSLDVGEFGNRDNQSYAISRTLTKMLPTNGEMQTAVWAAVSVRDRIADLDAIDSVQVDTTHVGYKFLGKDPEKWKPTTRETADHSLPYTVARALLDGAITIESYSDEAIRDPAALTLMQRISVREDPALTEIFPEYIPNRVAVTLTSGEVLTEEVRDAPGGGRVAMTDEQFEEKFHGLLRALAPEAQREEILSLAWGVENLPDLSPLLRATALDTT
ncbi:MmgE/PrpD family protein [Streptomyces swartbergensis]|uniref:2-methylcitrate dehydratase n=1 Tax=Streptomyces swartbergensis TaxID=487165 RepID=A0A2C9ZQ34_9ACTN|nr:MmgE/PrpD family protein [Streptomyces swartbergensis]OUD05080.1 2-methylcitrate dehydratase [Streptomyces swartbergensis]